MERARSKVSYNCLMAEKLLESIERKLRRGKELAKKNCVVIKDYTDRGYA